MDKQDVLKRAIEIIESGPLPYDYAEHGEYCPYCAISKAKTDLDEENDTGLSTSNCFRQLIHGWDFSGEEDAPLVDARQAISKDGALLPPYFKDKTLEVLKIALLEGEA